MSKQLFIYTDGGSRGNPGPAAFGVVIKENEKTIHGFGKAIGITTNNVAEYSGILEALRWVYNNRESLGEISGITCRMDSLLACQQLKGIYKVKKPHLAEFLLKIREMEQKLKCSISYNHIPREKNKEADGFVNQALDNAV